MTQTFKNQHNGLGFVRFTQGNDIVYWMDFSFFRGVPHEVDFYPTTEINEQTIEFVADGYGVYDRYKSLGVSGKYGNGSIFIPKKEIPELLDWCKENFLEK